MAFIRSKKVGSKTAYYLVKSERNPGGKPRQKNLAYLGFSAPTNIIRKLADRYTQETANALKFAKANRFNESGSAQLKAEQILKEIKAIPVRAKSQARLKKWKRKNPQIASTVTPFTKFVNLINRSRVQIEDWTEDEPAESWRPMTKQHIKSELQWAVDLYKKL